MPLLGGDRHLGLDAVVVALIIHALLHGEDDFRQSQMIVNTCGWDTDCNAANVGCLLGIKNGLTGIDASPVDWRGPVADRLYLATADGGRAISDAVIETYHVVNTARALAGEPPLAPKDGARFHFSLPESVQGFQAAASARARVATLGHARAEDHVGLILFERLEQIIQNFRRILPVGVQHHDYV